jgi:hypothetical protein
MTGQQSTDPEFARRVTERAEGIRVELLRLLQAGPATAADLLPKVETGRTDLIEVDFQLSRLADEGKAVGSPGAAYRLT